jgi:hypothetical protein
MIKISQNYPVRAPRNINVGLNFPGGEADVLAGCGRRQRQRSEVLLHLAHGAVACNGVVDGVDGAQVEVARVPRRRYAEAERGDVRVLFRELVCRLRVSTRRRGSLEHLGGMKPREPLAIARYIWQTNVNERSRISRTFANARERDTCTVSRAISVVLTRELSVFGIHLWVFGPMHLSFDVVLASVRENCSRASRSVS